MWRKVGIQANASICASYASLLFCLFHSFPYRIAEKFYFDPLKLDLEETSMEESVPSKMFSSVMGCSIDSRKALLSNVMLTGGNTLFEGLPQMLYKKLKQIGKARATSLKINASPERQISAWIGGSVLAELSSWMDEIVRLRLCFFVFSPMAGSLCDVASARSHKLTTTRRALL
jgi:hypothetical protein|eukprot:COSAG01_NODE_3089_length_6601_cov_9.640572_4_plen_174_part_00